MLTPYTCIALILLLPLLASICAGMLPKRLPSSLAHQITLFAVSISFILSLFIAKWFLWDGLPAVQALFYNWGTAGDFQFHLGFLLDPLSALMLVVVTFISLLVHIYSIGYMAGDPGYARFFCYISFFTFAMLLLVCANNFLQLYLGWEGVGLASYLLIGFWFEKESANAGSLKAFLINRVGDLGFLLGIAAVLSYFGSLDYDVVFSRAPFLADVTIPITAHTQWSVETVICILLFVGAMGKSAQMPLHVWLPESMEGPTPISALIHAATMVTAGVYMVSRMSPLFEYSATALSVVLIIGATTALFTGILALVQNDIKRVIAYSTLSQLGYMVAALGVSAYAAGMFHLVTHACFKALLFLTAGAVIIALHHEQNIQKMGNLRRYLPITYVSFLIGALALSAIPPFSGFYSKDAIIEAVSASNIFGGNYAYICLLLGAFFTSLYSFRLFFLVFHTNERFDVDMATHSISSCNEARAKSSSAVYEQVHEQRDKRATKLQLERRRVVHEPGWVMWLPSLILVIPSIVLGFLLVNPILNAHLLGNAIKVLPIHLPQETSLSAVQQLMNFWRHPAIWFALAGIFVAWVTVIKYPSMRQFFIQRFSWLYRILINKYGFDNFNQWVFVKGGKRLADVLFYVTDLRWLDGYVVNGTGRLIVLFSAKLKRLQTGYLYHYAFAMILGVLLFILMAFL